MATIVRRGRSIDLAKLSDAQYWGDACVACGHEFRPRELGRKVASVGLDNHSLRACPACVNTVKPQPAWPEVGAA